MYYVYIHTNKINGKKYCGMTNNIESRWRCNGIGYKPPKDRDTNRPFWNAIQKYGWENFEHKVIFELKTQELACEKEKEIIKALNLTNREKGYNVAEGGNGGRIYLEHPRGMKNKPQTEYNNECCRQRFLENNPMYNGVVWGVTHEHPKGFKGKHHSEESKQKMREKLQGKTFSKERNEKISKSLKGRTFSSEHKSKISNVRKEKGIAKGGKNPSAKKVKVTFKSGEFKIYDCTKDCKEDLGISQSIYDKCIKTQKPYSLSKYISQERRKKLEPLDGMKLEFY